MNFWANLEECEDFVKELLLFQQVSALFDTVNVAMEMAPWKF